MNWSLALRTSRLRRPNPGPSVNRPTVGSPVPAKARPKYAQPHSLCIQFSVSGFAGVGYRPIDWQANCSTKRRLLVRPMIANYGPRLVDETALRPVSF